MELAKLKQPKKKKEFNCVSDKCFQAYFIISSENPSSWGIWNGTISRTNMQTSASYRYQEACVNLMYSLIKFLNGFCSLFRDEKILFAAWRRKITQSLKGGSTSSSFRNQSTSFF
jgi:hypothetical protein